MGSHNLRIYLNAVLPGYQVTPHEKSAVRPAVVYNRCSHLGSILTYNSPILSMLFIQQVLALITFFSTHIPLDGRYTEVVRGLATCTHLRVTLGENVVASSGARYRAGTSSAWNLFNTQHVPVCVVLPRETSHVQAAMKAIYNNKLRYAVQAGGHSAMKGWNKYVISCSIDADVDSKMSLFSVHGGILISFSEMKDVTYNPQNDSITLEPGVSWEDAIAAVEPHGVAPLGGRVGSVAIRLLVIPNTDSEQYCRHGPATRRRS